MSLASPRFIATRNAAWKSDRVFWLWLADECLCGAVRERDEVAYALAATSNSFAHTGVLGLVVSLVTLPVAALHTRLGQSPLNETEREAEYDNGDYLLRDKENFRLEAADIQLALFSQRPAPAPASTFVQNLQLYIANGPTWHFSLASKSGAEELKAALGECGVHTRS